MSELRRATALSLGVESRGPFQWRGNGTLLLTNDEVVFRQWLPRREVRIPRADILEVDGRTRSHLGKTIGYRLLKIRWRTAGGGEDAIAMFVRDLEGWLRALGARAQS